MKILRSFGFGIFLVVLGLVMPPVLAELTKTIVVFLQSAQKAFIAAGVIASYAGQIPR